MICPDLGLDGIATAPRFGFAELSEQFDFPEHFGKGFVLATLHPETRAPQKTQNMIDGLLEALETTGEPVIFTYPNADPYSDVIIAAITKRAQENPNVVVIKNFGLRWFYTAMNLATCVVGNSSSGIIEAASFGLPVVNIGDRQKGRYCEDNVIHCAIDTPSIVAAVATAIRPDTRAKLADFQNPYGDGRAIPRVLNVLSSIQWSQGQATKEFYDVDTAYSGKMLEIS